MGALPVTRQTGDRLARFFQSELKLLNDMMLDTAATPT